MNPYVRRIDISDVLGRIVEVTREDIQVQHEDTVATTAGNKRIIVQTGVVNESRLIHLGQTPAHRVAFADRCLDSVIYLLPNVDMYVIDTVVTLCGLSAVLVIARLCDVIQLTPSERCLAVTNINGVFVYVIGLVDKEV